MRPFKTAGVVLGGALLSLGVVEKPAEALTTPQIVASSLSTQCLDYQVIGICVWLNCSWSGCSIRTSVQVRHFIPELVVSSYENTGDNPWWEVATLSPPLGEALAGGQSTSDVSRAQHEHLRFKNVDAIGHPAGEAFSSFASAFGMTCAGAATPFQPYHLSTLDALAWRSGIPESLYPEALTPGMRELGQPGDLWGNIYPRSGFLTQVHDYKTAATTAQRSADVVTRTGQPHVYTPLVAASRDGYWPPGPVKEGDPSTHRWQRLTPSMSKSCRVWPDRGVADTYDDRLDTGGDYAWSLWRPYRCCKRRGQTLLYAVP
ncbi:TIGR03756 family integrating conjugative element protein [Vreelandella nigrificans]|uniref:TIGR03756 family integrating conjugative element protein n=1 Tax=Vreelandella nigrificans TaxID=2042704 RepID=A0A2A4HGS1_9GAMM|nr:TIGR03756 family integrating conjugative element protein [Halomonas nigrificans]PCF93519.1 TIGR03756 family integrating conjugative element protein [Halomonas nigrificans]